MLTFSANSWHRRMAGFGNSYGVSDNLCPYVREVLWGLTKFIAVASVFAFFFTGAVYFHASMYELGFQNAFFYAFQTQESFIAAWFMVTSIITYLITAIAVICGIGFLHERYTKYREAKLIASMGAEKYWDMVRQKGDAAMEPKPYKEPGLIRAWLNANHDKICPKVSFK